MKVIKKITAIMLSIMMVLGMCSVVGAAETASGSYGENNGIIKITSAIKDQNYTIYRMLKLESFSGNNYSYTAETGWGNFVETVTTSNNIKYFIVDNGYVKWNSAVEDNDANKAELAKKALDYAKDDTTHTIPASTKLYGNSRCIRNGKLHESSTRLLPGRFKCGCTLWSYYNK